jgi:hypothetical protein
LVWVVWVSWFTVGVREIAVKAGTIGRKSLVVIY